jgi:hypothetical protein
MVTKIKVYSSFIDVPDNMNYKADKFIGKWTKARKKALERVIGLTNNTVKEYNFDELVDMYTVHYYVKDD